APPAPLRSSRRQWPSLRCPRMIPPPLAGEGREGAGDAAAERLRDTLQHALGVPFDLVVPKAHDPPAMRLKPSGAPLIVSFSRSVLSTIHLDHQRVLHTREVDD